jgi:hypothetical protein
MILVPVVVWSFIFFWSITLAKDYGRSRLTWGILGAFFGIFAVITLLILGPKR